MAESSSAKRCGRRERRRSSFLSTSARHREARITFTLLFFELEGFRSVPRTTWSSGRPRSIRGSRRGRIEPHEPVDCAQIQLLEHADALERQTARRRDGVDRRGNQRGAGFHHRRSRGARALHLCRAPTSSAGSKRPYRSNVIDQPLLSVSDHLSATCIGPKHPLFVANAAEELDIRRKRRSNSRSRRDVGAASGGERVEMHRLSAFGNSGSRRT